MAHAMTQQKSLIALRIEEINKEMLHSDDGLPAVSVSVGIACGSDMEDGEDLFEKSDKAMYQAKKSGKSTFHFDLSDSASSISVD